jgi:hypothetical protein
MPIEDYSHMVMENRHMVDGDGVGDDNSEESLEIPLSGVESRILQPPKMKIMMVAALWVSKNSVLLGLGFFPAYKGVRRRKGRGGHRGPNGPGWRGLLGGLRHLVSFAGQVAPGLRLHLKLLLLYKNFGGIFPRIYFHHFLHQKGKKVFLLKIA